MERWEEVANEIEDNFRKLAANSGTPDSGDLQGLIWNLFNSKKVKFSFRDFERILNYWIDKYK